MYLTFLKILHKCIKLMIPFSWCLFQPIQTPFELTYHLLLKKTLQSIACIYVFMQIIMSKSWFSIHLYILHIFLSCKRSLLNFNIGYIILIYFSLQDYCNMGEHTHNMCLNIIICTCFTYAQCIFLHHFGQLFIYNAWLGVVIL